MSILSAVACEVKAQEYVQRLIAYCNICHDHIVTHVGWGPVPSDDVLGDRIFRLRTPGEVLEHSICDHL